MASINTSLRADTSLKGIVKLTLPISVAKLIPELNYLFNAIFLGHVGTLELALVGVTGVYYLIFAAIGYGLNNAILSIMSRRAGEDNRSALGSTFSHGLLLAIIMATVIVAFTSLGISRVFGLTGIDATSAAMASKFLQIRIWGIFFLFILQLQNAFLISLQQSKHIILASIMAAGSNVGLDYLLIFGKFGFPQLGFYGAAYASVLSELIGVVSMFGVIFMLKIPKRFSISFDWTFKTKTLKLVLVTGLPLMLQYAVSTFAWWVFFILVSRNYSVAEQALTQAMRNLFGLSGVFSWSFGSACNSIVSNLLGQGDRTAIFPTLRKLLFISALGMTSFVIVLNIWPLAFLNLYGQDVSFYIYGLSTLRIVSIAMIILTFGVVFLNSVVATGRTDIVLYIELVSILLYSIYTWYVIELYKLSLNFAWMSEWVYWISILILSIYYLKYWLRNAQKDALSIN